MSYARQVIDCILEWGDECAVGSDERLLSNFRHEAWQNRIEIHAPIDFAWSEMTGRSGNHRFRWTLIDEWGWGTPDAMAVSFVKRRKPDDVAFCLWGIPSGRVYVLVEPSEIADFRKAITQWERQFLQRSMCAEGVSDDVNNFIDFANEAESNTFKISSSPIGFIINYDWVRWAPVYSTGSVRWLVTQRGPGDFPVRLRSTNTTHSSYYLLLKPGEVEKFKAQLVDWERRSLQWDMDIDEGRVGDEDDEVSFINSGQKKSPQHDRFLALKHECEANTIMVSFDPVYFIENFRGPDVDWFEGKSLGFKLKGKPVCKCTWSNLAELARWREQGDIAIRIGAANPTLNSVYLLIEPGKLDLLKKALLLWERRALQRTLES
jgi:hypothetical protein